MKAVVIYYSKTGFTEKYAQWLAGELDCPCLSLDKGKKADLSAYDLILYGSSFRSGAVGKLGWFRKKVLPLDKKNIVFVTGATAPKSPEIKKALERNFTGEEREKVKIFYLHSGLNYEKMGLGDRMMMSAFRKILANKKDRSQAERSTAMMLRKSFDFSDPSYVEPVLEYIRGITE
ncbi:MAG: flavodoxin domain-containing protein [Candidatus Limivivens sp.]|nr:flavodoxin domain-containing protein [Candidatus Limivivens sp.]